MPKVVQRRLVVPSTKEICTAKFMEWWNLEELSEIVSQINPDILAMFTTHHEDISTPEKLAEILYDTVGSRFLRNIDNSVLKRRLFLHLLLVTVTEKGIVPEKDLVKEIRSSVSAGKARGLKSVQDIVDLDITTKWTLRLAEVLGLPPTVAEKEHVESLPDTEIIEPHVDINPLYDYQYASSTYIRRMMEGTVSEATGPVKRKLIAVPTGSGKTRMVIESLIEWLNDGKPSKNEQQNKSRFILWIAQSNELCEQAVSTFKSVFESRGRRGTTLRIHRFWGTGGALPSLEMDDLLDDKGIIVATIQSMFKILKNDESQIEILATYTSCIIIDEAHHAIAETYSKVLRAMGFNWDNRKSEISERGIILLGLTATPFRGRGNNVETAQLERRLNGVYFPAILHANESEHFPPRAIVDCQTLAYMGEPVRVIGERSYHRGGYIGEDGYSWRIRRMNVEKPEDERNREFEGKKNIGFEFDAVGEYEITLTIRDSLDRTASDTARIRVEKKPKEKKGVSPAMRQKNLYHKLIRRKILCDVYHKILPSQHFTLDSQDTAYMEKFGEFRRETIKEIGRNYSRNKMIVEEIRHLWKDGKKKILFFACSVDHSRQIAMLIKTLYGMKSRYVDSKMDLDARVSAIEIFRSGDLDVLCNFDVLTAGFDAPNIDCVFVGRPVKSTLLYTQMIGRGMRGIQNGGTPEVLLVDIDDNFQISDRSMEKVELGWKVYQPYWKPWIDTALQMGIEEEVDYEDEDTDLSYSCSRCGKTAAGIKSIGETFGIEGSGDVLAQCLESGNTDALPSECAECRMSGV